MSPEMIMRTGHSYAQDWWALGILTYEFIMGFQPFYSKDESCNLRKLIIQGSVNFPDHRFDIKISENCKDFILKLLRKQEKDRLGTEGGSQEILSHPWLSEINPQKVLSKDIIAEYIPDIESSDNYNSRFFD